MSRNEWLMFVRCYTDITIDRHIRHKMFDDYFATENEQK
jgi:hypothetical protein